MAGSGYPVEAGAGRGNGWGGYPVAADGPRKRLGWIPSSGGAGACGAT